MKARILIVLILSTLFFSACRSDRLLLNVAFQHLTGIEKGDRVLFQGNAAGYVKDIQFNSDGQYVVMISLEKGFENAATEHSKFFVIDDPRRQGRQGIDIRLNKLGGTPLGSGSSIAGESIDGDLPYALQQSLEGGIEFVQKYIDKLNQGVQDFSKSKEYESLRKSLEDFASEIESKEKKVREKIKKEWLPKIQNELDALRKSLKQKGREDELSPLDQKLEEILRI